MIIQGASDVGITERKVRDNMTDAISRQAAIDIVTPYDDNRAMRDALEELPPAQPKRGKWIKTARWGRVYYCNQCRNYLDFDGVNAGRGNANFCPHCGAKMEVTT